MITGDPGTFVPLIASYFGPHDNMLDVGSGGGIVGVDRWHMPLDNIWTLDIYPPETPWRNFRLGNALDVATLFGAKSFDVVMACEILEHLEKVDGPRLLSELEKVARRLVIGTTPNGFIEQDPEKAPHEPWAKNPHQKHLCGWSAPELIDLGYCVVANGAPPADRRDIFPGAASLIFWKQVY